MSKAGYGNGPYGLSPYGDGSPAPLNLLRAVATAENVVQLQFDQPVYWSGLLDEFDASQTQDFLVNIVAGTIGLDGNPVQPVAPATVAVSTVLPLGAGPGTCLDVTLDRPMSSAPTLYTITVEDLASADLISLLSPTTLQFEGLYHLLSIPSVASPTPRRDFANPQTASNAGALGVVSNVGLGTFVVDSSGDYAIDQGVESYKKRVMRRLMTVPGGFVHLGQGYGVGIPSLGKKLALASTRQQVKATAELQIMQEPETESVTVSTMMTQDGRFFIMARCIMRGAGQVNVSAAVPLAA